MIKFKNDYSINYIYSFKNENKIITCNDNSTLKIIKIDKNEHKILQTLKAHEKEVYKVINLNNNNLCSCSNDETIRIWEKQNDLYNNVFTLKGDKYIEDILEIKNNIIVSSSAWDYSLIFWDLNKKERIKKLNNIICFYWNNILCKINEDFLLVGGIGSIYLINLNNYDINKFDCEENNILCLCKINEKYFFSGDNRGNLKQWKFNGKTIKIINNKENSHNKDINEIILNDENIITCSSDNKIKIWE
jgi:WD40 repeat protein